MKYMHSSACIAVLMVLGGCASEAPLRDGARQLSVQVDKARENAVRFADARNRIAAARVANLNYLQASTLRTEQLIQTELQAHEITQDKTWAALFEALRKAPEVTVKQRQESRALDDAAQAALASARSSVDVKAGRLTEASASLASLAEDRSRTDELKFLWGYLKQVNEAVSKKAEDASAASEGAAAATNKSTTK